MSAPRLPTDELEMSFTLSYEPSTLTRLLSCHSTLERTSRDSERPVVTLARTRSARRLPNGLSAASYFTPRIQEQQFQLLTAIRSP